MSRQTINRRCDKDGRTTYIYIIRAVGTDAFKVGVSNGPRGRLSTIQTGCPIKVELAHVFRVGQRSVALNIEHDLHASLKTHAAPGGTEWFCGRTAYAKALQQLRKHNLIEYKQDYTPSPVILELGE